MLLGYMSNTKSKSHGKMLTLRALVPSLPTSFPQFHFSETDYLYQLLRGDLPFAEVMAIIEQNNLDRLIWMSKLPVCTNKKKYTGYENWFCWHLTEQITSRMSGVKNGTVLTESVVCFPFLWRLMSDRPNTFVIIHI